jgi:Protein of unknown function (DUF3309)
MPAIAHPAVTLTSSVRWRTDRTRCGGYPLSVCPESAYNRSEGEPTKEQTMSIGTILLVVLVLMLVGALPVWQHASGWGYGPSGVLGAVLLVIVVLFLMGRLHP